MVHPTLAAVAAALREGRDPWPGLHGFGSTVVPQLERALIAGHDGVLLGEFGEERRNLTPIAEIPAVMKNAVLPGATLNILCKPAASPSPTILTNATVTPTNPSTAVLVKHGKKTKRRTYRTTTTRAATRRRPG